MWIEYYLAHHRRTVIRQSRNECFIEKFAIFPRQVNRRYEQQRAGDIRCVYTIDWGTYLGRRWPSSLSYISFVSQENCALVLPQLTKFCEICENREQFRWIKNVMTKLHESVHMENASCHKVSVNLSINVFSHILAWWLNDLFSKSISFIVSANRIRFWCHPRASWINCVRW